MIWAVVPAAGSGSRFQGELPKQYQEVAGRAVLEHCLWRLGSHRQIVGVAVALSPDDQRFAQLQMPPGLQIRSVVGGDQRADSVLAALQALPDEVDAAQAVLVHDAARPCVSLEMLDRLLVHAGSADGALLAVPCHDTLKQIDPGEASPRSLATAERSQYWLAQTPQLFPRGALSAALIAARERGLSVTDEAMAMELRGARPHLVMGSTSNRKLTVADDLAPISAWLQANPIPEHTEERA